MHLIATQILLLCMTATYCQYYDYSGSCLDPYSQYAYSQSAYNQYGAYGYPSYSVPGYDYLQQAYSSYPDGTQQPIVIVVDGDDDDDDDDDEWDMLDIVTTIASLRGNDGGNNGLVYIPYPVPMSCDRCDFDNDFDCYGCSSCGCNKGCNCRNWDNSYYDYDCNGDYCCDTGKKRRQKCRSGSRCSNSDCGCDKCRTIKHKCGRCRN